ncbi:MAG TPA: PAS domain-containing protein [Terriglobales bacterium]|nr:PAS domain-containing protein [Terriglobales bacterium]
MVIDSDSPVPDLPGMSGRHIARAGADSFHSPKLLRLFTWWQETAQDHAPGFADFDILQHPMLAPHLFVIAPRDDGYCLRLAGEEYGGLFNLKKGHHWRRQSDDIMDRDFSLYLDFVSKQAVPYYSRGHLALHERDWLHFESLLCPVAETVNGPTLLGACARIGG